jgi:hypothetical protein
MPNSSSDSWKDTALSAAGRLLALILALVVGYSIGDRDTAVSAVGDHSQRIAKLEAKFEYMERALIRIETKIDRLSEN